MDQNMFFELAQVCPLFKPHISAPYVEKASGTRTISRTTLVDDQSHLAWTLAKGDN